MLHLLREFSWASYLQHCCSLAGDHLLAKHGSRISERRFASGRHMFCLLEAAFLHSRVLFLYSFSSLLWDRRKAVSECTRKTKETFLTVFKWFLIIIGYNYLSYLYINAGQLNIDSPWQFRYFTSYRTCILSNNLPSLVFTAQIVSSGMQAKLKAPQSDLFYWRQCSLRRRIKSWVNSHHYSEQE